MQVLVITGTRSSALLDSTSIRGLDDAWRSAMIGLGRAAITILTMPLSLRYRYGLGRGVG